MASAKSRASPLILSNTSCNFALGRKRLSPFRKGNVRFFALDSNQVDSAQVAWLEAQLLAVGEHHVAVALHSDAVVDITVAVLALVIARMTSYEAPDSAQNAGSVRLRPDQAAAPGAWAVSFADTDTLDALARTAKDNDYRLRDILQAIVASDEFHTK